MSEAPREVLHVDVSSSADGAIVRMTLAGELDLVSTDAFTRAVADALRGGIARLVVDLAGLTFVDSSGINALVQAARAVEADGGSAVLAAPGPATRRIFEIARVTDLVEVVEAVEADPPLVDRVPREDKQQ